MTSQEAFRIFVEKGHYYSWLGFRGEKNEVIERAKYILDHVVTTYSGLFKDFSREEVEEIRISAAEMNDDAMDDRKKHRKLLEEVFLAIPYEYTDKAILLGLQMIFLNATPDNRERVEEVAGSFLKTFPLSKNLGEEAFRVFKTLYC